MLLSGQGHGPPQELAAWTLRDTVVPVPGGPHDCSFLCGLLLGVKFKFMGPGRRAALPRPTYPTPRNGTAKVLLALPQPQPLLATAPLRGLVLLHLNSSLGSGCALPHVGPWRFATTSEMPDKRLTTEGWLSLSWHHGFAYNSSFSPPSAPAPSCSGHYLHGPAQDPAPDEGGLYGD